MIIMNSKIISQGSLSHPTTLRLPVSLFFTYFVSIHFSLIYTQHTHSIPLLFIQKNFISNAPKRKRNIFSACYCISALSPRPFRAQSSGKKKKFSRYLNRDIHQNILKCRVLAQRGSRRIFSSFRDIGNDIFFDERKEDNQKTLKAY